MSFYLVELGKHLTEGTKINASHKFPVIKWMCLTYVF